MGQKPFSLEQMQIDLMDPPSGTFYNCGILQFSFWLFYFQSSIWHFPFCIFYFEFSILHFLFWIFNFELSMFNFPFLIFHFPFSIFHFQFSIFKFLFWIFHFQFSNLPLTIKSKVQQYVHIISFEIDIGTSKIQNVRIKKSNYKIIFVICNFIHGAFNRFLKEPLSIQMYSHGHPPTCVAV